MKKGIAILLLIFSVTITAQNNFQGRAIYQSKTTVDMSGWGGGQMTEQRKKQIMARMKNMLEKTYILNFNRSASTYKEEEKLEAPGSGRGFNWSGMMGGGGTKYKNTTEGKILESTEFFGERFLITEDAKKPEWEVTGESKQIGNYMAFKATMMQPTNPLDWSNMRRRRRGRDRDKDKEKEQKEEAKKDTTNVVKVSEDIEMPKEVLVTAWFTPQIPVSNGPGDYWGLPGLILEVNAGRTTLLCTEIVMNPKEKIEIKEPTKGKELTRKEYTELVTQKMKEMRERFRGRRGRGRGRF